MRAKFQIIFLLFIKLKIALSVPRVLTNFSCPSAICGGSPAKINDGTSTSPAPPAIASINPATKEAKISKQSPKTNEFCKIEPSMYSIYSSPKIISLLRKKFILFAP